jgi:hypothetical protein
MPTDGSPSEEAADEPQKKKIAEETDPENPRSPMGSPPRKKADKEEKVPRKEDLPPRKNLIQVNKIFI